jgi:hypothetical protein
MAEHVTLSMSGFQHSAIHAHLFPGDGLEAVAVLVCGRHRGARHRLLVRKVVPVPHEACSRTKDRVTWSTDILDPLLVEARQRNDALVKIHSHSHARGFSSTDDFADLELIPSLHALLDTDEPLGSAIMLETGMVFGRSVSGEGEFTAFEQVSVAGDDICIWRPLAAEVPVPDFGLRIAQSFGKGTFELLRNLKIGVVGCSGTGSPTVEMLARNCVGELVLVDPDVVEEKNLNRILNATMDDAKAGRPKVEVLARAIEQMSLGTRVHAYQANLFDPGIVDALADCDVLFGCMDSIDGRHLLNRLAAFYSIPFFDVGVKLEADGKGGVDQVCGSVHYLQPGGSSLVSRDVYTLEQVRTAGIARTDPATYRQQIFEGYLRGAAEDQPAVIQLNMLLASLAVNELLARLHPYRLDPNAAFAIRRISLSHGIFESAEDGEPCLTLARHVGRGDVEPLLDWPELSRSNAE